MAQLADIRGIQGSVELESRPCPLGCSGSDSVVLTGYDRLNHLPGAFRVVRCKSCGLMRTDPRPTPESIGFYYPIDYGPYRYTREANGGAKKDTEGYWKRLVRRSFHFHTDRLPSMSPGRMLEIGCASGAFLHRMASKGWEVEGIEFSKGAVDSARSLGYQVHMGTVENSPDPVKVYDLIVGWMVLEHLHDPLLALWKLHQWIKPGGRLVLSVPNAGAVEFKIFKARWYALHLPNHLYHYTPATLLRVLDATGWRAVRFFHQRILTNFIASTGYWLQDHGILSRLSKKLVVLPEGRGRLNYLLYPLASVLGIFGQTGRMTVWAERIDD